MGTTGALEGECFQHAERNTVQRPWSVCKPGFLEEQPGNSVGVGMEVSRGVVESFGKF